MRRSCTRRQWLQGAAGMVSAALTGAIGSGQAVAPPRAKRADHRLEDETFAFIERCRREDGGYAPSPDAAYAGNSDTKFSDLAAVTYAAVLAKTVGRKLPHADRPDQCAPPRRELRPLSPAELQVEHERCRHHRPQSPGSSDRRRRFRRRRRS